ncbi:hypothetical protein LP52_06700 [Streptomonospora alba]|uniref:Uncharacterized protein n=2 Tax=Streptomonospora alba TaxID=183763 RepID=A0A0C2G8F9_9ACTN|nr:hypothetical protein LP52_06700 [Streptomonospora alba]
MSGITGTWHLRMKTPIGTIDAHYRFTDTGDGLTGIAAGAGEQVPLHDIVREPVTGGERVIWQQSITKPLRLNLAYDVTVVGDHLTGHSRAGRLPRTAVTGERTGA